MTLWNGGMEWQKMWQPLVTWLFILMMCSGNTCSDDLVASNLSIHILSVDWLSQPEWAPDFILRTFS